MKYHKTWWGEEFVAALEGFIDSGRLQRGRAYRTDSRILAFEHQGSKVSATIRGNINPYFGVTKEPRYKIKLDFKPIAKTKWKKIIQSICENAGWLSKLMLNEIPHDLNLAFDKDSLLPKSYQDVDATCSCPDYENPCKHIAGVYYKIANILDSNPMLLFSLKGFEPEALHKELKKTELGQAFAEHLTMPEDIALEYDEHLFTPITSSDKFSAKSSQERFWHMGNWDLEERDDSDELSITAALIKKQGDYPPFWDKATSFIGAMEEFYQTTKKKNRKFVL